MKESQGLDYFMSIAGMGIHLRIHDADLFKLVRSRYQRFSKAEPRLEMICDLVVQPELLEFASNEFKVNFRSDGLAFTGHAAKGEIDLQSCRAAFFTASPRAEFAVDYFLRLLYSLLAFKTGGLMLHGAGIQRAGQVAVFFGHSGSGKTTVSRLSGADAVLNDDLLLLLPDGKGWQVAATPFWNPSQVPPSVGQAPLGGLFRLVQDQRVFLQHASPAVAIAELLSSTPVVNEDPLHMPALLERLSRLNAVCPVQFLHFLPDDSFWSVVDPFLTSCA